MKGKLATLVLLGSLAGLSACHYGREQVEQDLKRNEEYKGIRAEREAATALPADAADRMNGTVKADTAATDTTAK